MDIQEAIKIIDAVSQSLRNDPSQFHYEVHIGDITGLKVTQTGPGVGYISSVTGGGIGTQITVSGPNFRDIQLVRRAVDETIRRDVNKALEILKELKLEISKEKPSKSSLEKILEGLKNTVLTPALIATVQAAISMALQG